MLKTRPSDVCFDNCKPIEIKLKEIADTNKKLSFGDLLHVKLLKTKARYIICKWLKK